MIVFGIKFTGRSFHVLGGGGKKRICVIPKFYTLFVPTVFTLHSAQKDSFNFTLSVSGSSSAGGTRNEEINVSSFSALIRIYGKRQPTQSWGDKVVGNAQKKP